MLPLLRFSLLACTSEPLPVPEEGPGQVGPQEESVGRDKILNWSRTTLDPFAGAREEPWPPELIQGDHSEPHPMEPHLPKEAVAEASQPSAQAQPIPAPVRRHVERHHWGARGQSSCPDHS